MAEADRIAAALQYIDEQKPADPFASLKSDPIGALRSAWERKVDPIINNAKRTFATGGVLGDILRAYGEAGAPANRAVLKGMGMPYKDPAVVNTPPTLAPDNSYGNMGDATAQTFGTIIGDPLNFVQPGAARIANALKFAKPDALKMLNEMSQGARSPMDVWHGTPHRFPPTAKNPLGEFDASKIGTGEGAQAYGHGLYFAEAPGVAKGYQIQNAYKAFDIGEEAAKRGIPLNASGRGEFSRQAAANKSDPVKAAKGLQNANAAARSIPSEDLQKMFADYAERGGGSLYKVDLPDEQIAKMLDWDKPLSKQHPDVQKVISSDPRIARLIASGKIDNMYQSGGEFYRAINSKYANDAPALISLDAAENAAQANASQYLKSLGIPGIRYLDGGSRAGGKGTSNFVVFDPKHMNIIGRE